MDEQDIPIDIHTGKLQEWLISRRIVPKNWQNQVLVIRNKISNSVNDMPANEELIKLLSGAHINYFHCLQIIEILKTTEADTKSLFGRYGSQRMKDWQEIVRLYEKDNVYLGEAAQILVRNIVYEIPGLKKQITKFDQMSDECQKKINDLTKTEAIVLNERTILCDQLGIKGIDLKSEFLKKLQELPQFYAGCIIDIKKLIKAIDIYKEFIGNESDNLLPLIKHIIEYGNTTVYQFLHGETPISILEPQITLNLTIEDYQNASVNTTEIDFGDDIDFSINTDMNSNGNEINLEVGDIDWGDPNDNSNNNDIIDIENISLEESGIIIEGSGQDGGIAKGMEAYTLLDNPTYRNQFINEILELESFLKMRLFELHSLENATSLTFSLIDQISSHDSNSIQNALNDVEKIYQKITSDVIEHLHQLKHSPKYGDLLAGKLQQKLIAVEKFKATRIILKEKCNSFHVEREKIGPMISKTIEQTKILQDQIERDISRRYKNRMVHLIGGINMFK